MNDDSGNIFVLRGGRRRSTQPASHLALRRALQTSDYTIGMFAMNTFARRPMLMKPVPRPNLPLCGDFMSRPLKDSDITALIEHFDAVHGFKKLSMGMVRDVVLLEADTNSYSPPATRIRALVWDTVPRLDQFFIKYAGIEIEGDSDEERTRFRVYVESVTRCFFISIVARVMKPGCKADHTLVLEGRQGARKSSLLRVLSLDEEWFSDSMPHDLADKDARQHLPGKLVVELAEIAQLKKSELETVKAFLTCQHDQYRPSFGRFEVDWPRQNVFVGTTNADEYLVDTTGNRRFWPLRTTTIYVADAATVIEQVYAEAYAAFEAGENWWLDPDAEETAREEQAARVQDDPWYGDVARIVDELLAERMPDATGCIWITARNVLDKLLGVALEKRVPREEKRIAAILGQLGGRKARRRLDNNKLGGRMERGFRFDRATR